MEAFEGKNYKLHFYGALRKHRSRHISCVPELSYVIMVANDTLITENLETRLVRTWGFGKSVQSSSTF